MRQCDGAVPSCSRCATKGAICNYDVEPNVARSTSLRRRHDALQDEVEQLRRFIGLLHDRSDTEAMELFRRVRTTIDPSEVVKSFLAARDDTSTPDADEPASIPTKAAFYRRLCPSRASERVLKRNWSKGRRQALSILLGL